MDKKVIIMYAIFSAAILGAFIGMFLGCIFFVAAMLLISAATVAAAGILQEECRRRLQKEKSVLQDEQESLRVQCERKNEETTEQAKQQIAQFHSQVSHGLRIPISVVHGYAELLCGNLVTEEGIRREYLNKICDRIVYIEELLSRLLMEARMNADLPELIFQDVDVLELVQQIKRDMELVAQKREIEINVVSAESDVCIFGDQTQLTKAFYNIIENALKYMGKSGKIDITVSRTKEEQICVSFKDDGNGLSKEETAHIFDSGFQGSNHVGGSGMGLSIVKMVVLAHGGEAYARSSPGRGMGIFLFLPIRPKNPRIK